MPRPIRIKGFHIFRDRHGKWRCYHRKTRTAIDLAKAPLGSAEFLAECARISALTKAAGSPKPGTLGLLIVEYRSSVAFADLAERTRADYQRAFDYLVRSPTRRWLASTGRLWSAFATGAWRSTAAASATT